MATMSAKSSLYQHVAQLRERYLITFASYPLDTVSLCRQGAVHIAYHAFHTAGFCALAFLGSKNDTVVLNSNRSRVEVNFDCGHELIHLTKHRKRNIDYFNCFDQAQPLQNPFMEWEANEGAAELLVPYQMFLPAFYEACAGTQNDLQQVADHLALKFNVSPTVIFFRLRSLQYELYQYAALQIPLERIVLKSQGELRREKLLSYTALDFYCRRCGTELRQIQQNCDVCKANLIDCGIQFHLNRSQIN